MSRELDFVRESDALQQASTQPGHRIALAEAQQRAHAGKPLDIPTLCSWQAHVAGIAVAAVRPGTGPALQELLDEINERAAAAGEAQAAELIGDWLYGFSTIDPFEDSRVGRLVAAYLATRCRVPVIVFRASDAAALDRARSIPAMRALVADKLRENAPQGPPTTKHVSIRDGEGLVHLATFKLDGDRVIATYQAADYQRDVEQMGLGAMLDGTFRIVKPADGKVFFDALDNAYSQSTNMVITIGESPPVPPRVAPAGNFAGYVCPRCHSSEVIGRTRRFGSRTIEELNCTNCGLAENADSNEPTYPVVLARWRS